MRKPHDLVLVHGPSVSRRPSGLTGHRDHRGHAGVRPPSRASSAVASSRGRGRPPSRARAPGRRPARSPMTSHGSPSARGPWRAQTLAGRGLREAAQADGLDEVVELAGRALGRALAARPAPITPPHHTPPVGLRDDPKHGPAKARPRNRAQDVLVAARRELGRGRSVAGLGGVLGARARGSGSGLGRGVRPHLARRPRRPPRSTPPQDREGPAQDATSAPPSAPPARTPPATKAASAEASARRPCPGRGRPRTRPGRRYRGGSRSPPSVLLFLRASPDADVERSCRLGRHRWVVDGVKRRRPTILADRTLGNFNKLRFYKIDNRRTSMVKNRRSPNAFPEVTQLMSARASADMVCHE